MTEKTLATTKGEAFALQELEKRKGSKPEKVNNSSLPAGSYMYFYCKSCGHLSDSLPENYMGKPKDLCNECQSLKDLGWLK